MLFRSEIKVRKEQIIEEILKNIKVENANIVRVYGVPCGVGYDMYVILNTGEVLETHALRQSWALEGHLRPNNPSYKYTGRCDNYQEEIISYWTSGLGLKDYLKRLTIKQLASF